MNDTSKKKIEHWFFVSLMIAACVVGMWLLATHPLLNAAILTISPSIGFWLFKIYQGNLEKTFIDNVGGGIILATILGAIFLGIKPEMSEAKIDNVFLQGKIRSKEVSDENNEGNIVSERRYAFFLKKRKRQLEKRNYKLVYVVPDSWITDNLP